MTCPALYETDILIDETNNKQLSPSITKSFPIGATKRGAFRHGYEQGQGVK